MKFRIKLFHATIKNSRGLDHINRGGLSMDFNSCIEKPKETDTWDFSGLRALFFSGMLKRTPELSHTQGPIDISSRHAARVPLWHPCPENSKGRQDRINA